ncbi:hypothetical protein BOTBODRAFT_596981 [Botryobasidium botryosum FD-172 SS1]|uniref:Protein kinase domain-containing protein n=1 Tax=Botryobasidium botryosum (strain FD-172 SS1) TaxID=930990 RepID=A0A067M6Q4_BOTB1|nr:hypothetical protein BOTBODRAFT_596981 [Botryobasidium botryosum FD-172 SS1]
MLGCHKQVSLPYPPLQVFLHRASRFRMFRCQYLVPFRGIRGTELYSRVYPPSDDVSLKANKLCLVSPWYSKGNAIGSDGWKLNRALVHAARALAYLHGQNPPVVHGNVKGSKIFETSSGDFVLSGITETIRLSDAPKSRDGLRWMAPELFNPDEGESKTIYTDVYAFGMTIIELFTKQPPFMDMAYDIDVMISVIDHKRPSRPDGIDRALWNIAEECWRYEPRSRPSMARVTTMLEGLKYSPSPIATSPD